LKKLFNKFNIKKFIDLNIKMVRLPRRCFAPAWLSAINGVPSQPSCLSSLCRQSAPRNDISILLTTLILIALSITSAAFADDIPKIRELPSNPVPVNNQTFKKEITKKLERSLTVTETKKTTQLKGGISELKAIVGKSQLIKFDEPVKRVSITDPALADLVIISPKEMLINGKEGGETSLIIWGTSGDPVMFNLFIQNDSINFVKEVKKIAPNDDVKVNFVNSGDQKSMKVAISGRISSTITRDKIKELAKAYGYTLVDNSESLTPQIMLEVKIVEIKKTITKTNGTKPSLTLKNNQKLIDLKSLKYNLNINSAGTYSGVLSQPDSSLQLALSASEEEGTARILAEPRLMSINGQAATFTSSDQIPVVSGRDEYGGLIIEYKNVGINVTFTPTILEESGRILLDIKPDISDYAADTTTTIEGFPLYIITTRSTSSKVEVEDKQTIVIGGLIRKKADMTKTKTPYIGHLPIIGNLLSSYTGAKNTDTELMIFVTPTIIKPDDVVNGV
jgi:pilus assembly protein CpaC